MLSNLLPVSLAILVNLQLFLVETQWEQTKRVGSGTIIDPDGTILTCAHLVPDTESTKAVLSGKVINLTLPVSLGVYFELLITGRQYL
jgi:S1-C subfamily serine protease